MTEYKEDDLTLAVLQWYKRRYDNRVVTIEPEAHYNHYGYRGVADLYVEIGQQDEGKVYEIKSELDNANEVIRQFNRMREYFFSDERRRKPDDIVFELAVIPTPENYDHVRKYRDMYRSLINDVNPARLGRVALHFRHPLDITPAHFFNSYTVGSSDWENWVNEMRPSIANALFKSESLPSN